MKCNLGVGRKVGPFLILRNRLCKGWEKVEATKKSNGQPRFEVKRCKKKKFPPLPSCSFYPLLTIIVFTHFIAFTHFVQYNKKKRGKVIA